MARVSIVGSDGQLGFDLVRELAAAGHDLTPWTHAEIEITDVDSVERAFAAASPEVVVNTAAVNVEGSERDPQLAQAVNADGAGNVARAAAAHGAQLIHLSTDYVFDGEKGAPYVESDATNPLNAYGRTKLGGEQQVLAADTGHLVVRSSGLYGEHGCKAKNGMNFVTTMLALAADRDELTIVSDEALSPTATRDLAEQIAVLIDRPGAIAGVVHATAGGGCSWLEFARAIFELAGVEVKTTPVASKQFAANSDLPILRPADTSLANARLAEAGLDRMSGWREQLERYLRAIGRLAAPRT